MTLKYLEQLEFKKKLVEWVEQTLSADHALKTLFVSLGNAEARCKVWSTTDLDVQKIIKRTVAYIDKSFAKNNSIIDFIKIDIAQNIQERVWSDVITEIQTQAHNNHFRKGISFDEQFGICLLEQEMYGRAVIRGVIYNEPNFIDEKNLKTTLDKYQLKSKHVFITKTL